MKRLIVSMLCVGISVSASRGQALCPGHDYPDDTGVRRGDPIFVDVFGKVGTQTERSIRKSAWWWRASGLGWARPRDTVAFRVEAQDNDSAICETETVPNFLQESELSVEVFVKGYGPRIVAIPMKDIGTSLKRKWIGSWEIPETVNVGGQTVALLGRELRFRFAGTVDDVFCKAPNHQYSGDKTVDMSDFKARLLILKAELRSVEFVSDHGVMTDWDANFGGALGNLYAAPEWVANPLRNNPISESRTTRVRTKATVKVEPGGLSFRLHGSGPDASWNFRGSRADSTGTDQVVEARAENALAASVAVTANPIAWGLRGDCGESPVGISGPHKAYVTWGNPAGGGYTEKRIGWVCAKAAGAESKEVCADRLHAGVAAETHFGNDNTDGWDLLDGGSGYCDQQARCMRLAVLMLGAGPASVRLVRASSNAGAGNCLDLEVDFIGEQKIYLVLDALAGAGYGWNAFEGCCEAAEHYYAITPTLKAADDYRMLKALGSQKGWQQFWVITNRRPGSENWRVISVVKEVPIP